MAGMRLYVDTNNWDQENPWVWEDTWEARPDQLPGSDGPDDAVLAARQDSSGAACPAGVTPTGCECNGGDATSASVSVSYLDTNRELLLEVQAR